MEETDVNMFVSSTNEGYQVYLNLVAVLTSYNFTVIRNGLLEQSFLPDHAQVYSDYIC